MKSQFPCLSYINAFMLSLLFCVTLCSIRIKGYSQSNEIDSLKNKLINNIPANKKAELYNDISFKLVYIDLTKSLTYADSALVQSIRTNDAKQIGRSYTNISNYYIGTNKMDSALYYLDSALFYYQKANYKKGIGLVEGNYGMIYYNTGNHGKSLKHFFKALEIFEESGDESNKADQLSAIANVYMENKNYPKAIYYDSMAYLIYKKLNIRDAMAMVEGNYGNIYADLNQHEKAIAAYHNAIAIYRELGYEWDLARNLSNLGSQLVETKQLHEAKIALEEAIKLSVKQEYKIGISGAYFNLGTCYYLSWLHSHGKQKEYQVIAADKSYLLQKSIDYTETSLRLNDDINPQVSANIYEKLAVLYEEIGDYKKALECQKNYSKAVDSLRKFENKIEIERLTTQREIELKNKQIELDKLAVEKKRNERLYFSIGFLLLASLMFLIYNNYRKQKSNASALNKLNLIISSTNEELLHKNTTLISTLEELQLTQQQLIESEKQKQAALTRSAISQDIHDDISSNLNKLTWLTRKLKSLILNSDDSISELIQKINNISSNTVDSLAEIIWSSNPERDNVDSLLSFIRSFANQYLEGSSYTLEIDFQEDYDNVSLSPAIRRNIYLVCKEAIHNAVKYAKGNKILLQFRLENKYATLSIADNGIGISNSSQKGSGYGMNNMAKRLASIGWNFELAVDKGTTITIHGKLS